MKPWEREWDKKPWEKYTAQEEQQPAPIPQGDRLAPVPEAALSLATRIPAGLLGLGAGAVGAMLPGEPGQGQRYMDKVANEFTYQPRDPTAQSITNAALWPFEKMAEGAQWAGRSVTDATGSPAAGALTEATTNFLPSLVLGGAKPVLGKLVSKGKAESAANISRNAAADANLKEIADAGYVFPATKTDPSFFKKRVESIGGKAALNQEATLRNQALTDSLARKAASLPDDAPITSQTLADAQRRLAAPYDEVASLSKTAASAWEAARQAKADARLQWNHYNRSAHPDALKKAQELDSERAIYEQIVDQEATALGRPDLVQKLREARMQLAKNYDVERAFNSTTGEVNASVIGRMYEKDKGKKMTGELATIGKYANRFPELSRRGSTAPTAGVSALEPYAATGLGLAGSASGMGWWPAGVVLARGPARSLALSKSMQAMPDRRPGLKFRLSEKAMNSTGALALSPMLGLQRPEEEQ